MVSIGWIWSYLTTCPSISSQGGLELLGVGGGVRNSTGHWAVSCYQIELAYYTLSLQVLCLRYKNETEPKKWLGRLVLPDRTGPLHVEPSRFQGIWDKTWPISRLYCGIQPGYKSQWQDCMICNYVGGPLLIRFKELSWFIMIRYSGLHQLMLLW